MKLHVIHRGKNFQQLYGDIIVHTRDIFIVRVKPYVIKLLLKLVPHEQNQQDITKDH